MCGILTNIKKINLIHNSINNIFEIIKIQILIFNNTKFIQIYAKTSLTARHKTVTHQIIKTKTISHLIRGGVGFLMKC